MQGFFEVTRNEDNFCVRAGLLQPVCEMAAAHLRHDHVREEQINFLVAALGDELLRVVAISCFDHVITKIAQNAHGDVAHANIVFQHKNCFCAH